MRNQIYIFVVTLLSCATASFGRFSEFVRISPECEQHERADISSHARRLRPTISFASDSRDQLDIEILLIRGGRRYWLVVCNEGVSPEKQNFRRDAQVLSHGSERVRRSLSPARDDVQLIVPMTACCERHEQRGEGEERRIIFRLSRELALRSYIYIDYPNWGTLDGGYYFTIDIPAYLKGFDEAHGKTEPSAGADALPRAAQP